MSYYIVVYNDHPDRTGWEISSQPIGYTRENWHTDDYYQAWAETIKARNMFPSLLYYPVILTPEQIKLRHSLKLDTLPVQRMIHFRMQDGNYILPASIIAHSRALHYADLDTGTTFETFNAEWIKIYQEEFDYTYSNEDEIFDWLRNNFNWEDIKNQVSFKAVEFDKEKLWRDADRFELKP